jgi:hypothetical protein
MKSHYGCVHLGTPRPIPLTEDRLNSAESSDIFVLWIVLKPWVRVTGEKPRSPHILSESHILSLIQFRLGTCVQVRFPSSPPLSLRAHQSDTSLPPARPRLHLPSACDIPSGPHKRSTLRSSEQSALPISPTTPVTHAKGTAFGPTLKAC